MYRRALLATAGMAVVGRPVDKLGELLALPGPAPVPLPARIDGIHVAQVRNLTRRLGAASNAATNPEVLSATTGPRTTSGPRWSWPPRPGTPTSRPKP